MFDDSKIHRQSRTSGSIKIPKLNRVKSKSKIIHTEYKKIMIKIIKLEIEKIE